MRFHLLQHVSFEGPAAIAGWLDDNHHSLTTTKFFKGDSLPAQESFDVLIVMGGPMGVEDVEQYPWLIEERQFIQQSIENDKPVLGICLGAQLIARACGARVIKNKYREIGWFKISINNTENLPAVVKDVFAENMEVFHWHGDTFEIPEDAVHFASSEACSNQGFILKGRVIGLQYHIETTALSANVLVDNCREELDGSEYVQTEEEINVDPEKYSRLNLVLFILLGNITALNQ
jgi:GMP synthase-like glutamine amidotransferase